ncbi:GtrA family protein [Paenibacillus aquistagni]|uniref:Putative flippase GtrA (Transmembrane translocase of bactoprenol-linked glucose) n=1 Tax=Paenibacillus aquistagni TaxID=1852522 RepID=A0A1X7LUA4_9BACL|nr:GtrA family protein [Paenibacillus aquistagni]NMM51898.1 GtrA family protein [Paenibacillus aquistagni]SMG56893.1 Putative flippase GtrA (transmembrane translocase of bactoprenol-linked glucose) [Paenibacillus aquistagni]
MHNEKLQSLRSFVTFGLVGVVNTGVDFAVFTLLAWCQLPWLLAQAAAYSCGVLNSFFMNRKWTFKQQEGPLLKGLARFVILNAITLVVTSIVIWLLHHHLGAAILWSKGAATLIGVVLNFVGSRLWVFKPAAASAESSMLSRSSG